MRLHYLQHVPFEDPGSILIWAKENGGVITNTQLYKNDPLPKQQDFDWLVVMGGPMNIYAEEDYPWLAAEKVFIREAIASGKVIIGLCLGAQLLADAIGGKVTRNLYQEIGWFPICLSEEVRSSPLFSFFPQQPVVFQWHGDTFSVLPEDAQNIAENDACQHQAFIYRKRVFGFQFHLENTPAIIKGLVENCGEEMVPNVYVQTPEEVLAHPEYIEQNNRWMDMFLTQLEAMDRKGEL
ncbi:type 1 glutamine amidotransferase [Desulfosporosinus fructosivorans]|uniref:Type 1 glutamine amidotransferase n=1 Tax=Desulfosporosinus fructosivorans TaxID=2018669 RepID=A0A4Z0R974_9FIRM|nr:type 1 glutamine amidotransferase [Desulfosporosinus fructosivorans]TGE38623.1 type 1 glutamine amidotransferase [Desulfosporosinus fructosivorans]